MKCQERKIGAGAFSGVLRRSRITQRPRTLADSGSIDPSRAPILNFPMRGPLSSPHVPRLTRSILHIIKGISSENVTERLGDSSYLCGVNESAGCPGGQ